MKQHIARNRIIAIFLVWTMLCAGFIAFLDFSEEASGATWIVDLGGGGDFTNIQNAINNSNDGDTIYVWDGTYYEHITVNKSMNLIGNGSANTIIEGSGSGTVVYVNVDWVNITGFTVMDGSDGILVQNAADTVIDDCDIHTNAGNGVSLYSVAQTTINNTDIYSNSYGIFMFDWDVDDTTISNCNISGNSQYGIYSDMGPRNTQIFDSIISENTQGGIFFWNTPSAIIRNNNISNNYYGIEVLNSGGTVIEDCDIFSNDYRGIRLYGYDYTISGCNFTSNFDAGIYLMGASNVKIRKTNIQNSANGIFAEGAFNVMVTNSSISTNSSSDDVYLDSNSKLTFLNTTFNRSSVNYADSKSELTVKWFMHVYVKDTLNNPVPNAEVIIRNATDTTIFNGLTEADGYRRWIEITEYFENATLRTNHTSHNITSYNSTLFGWANPESNMNTSKVVVVTLSMPKPGIDTIIIEDAIYGAWIGDRVYRIEDIIVFYAVGYNATIGFIGPVSSTWSSNDTGVGDVDLGPSIYTTFTAFTEGMCKITALNGSLSNSTGDLTVVWLVENLDQLTVHPTIQKAINAANPGDRLWAKSWEYHERVVVNKTVDLIGENTATTIIDGDFSGAPIYVMADDVSITGFTVKNGSGYGIGIDWFTNIIIDDCIVDSNGWSGVQIFASSDITINNTKVTGNTVGVFVFDWGANDLMMTNNNISGNSQYGIFVQNGPVGTLISDNNISNNGIYGIYLDNAPSTIIRNNSISGNDYGIHASWSSQTKIENCNIFSNNIMGIRLGGNNYKVNNCTITSNTDRGIYLDGISDSKIYGTKISNHNYGIYARAASNTMITNSSISTSSSYDIYMQSNSQLTLLNTTFNKSSVYYMDPDSELTVKWYTHVYVNDTLGSPIVGSEVIIKNATDVVIFNGFTESDGYIRWIVVTEYLENQTRKLDLTPHNVTSYNYTHIGWAIPKPSLNASKTVNVTLSALRPVIDYIVIEESINGSWVGDSQYLIEDTDVFYATGYNLSVGFVGLVRATWSVNNPAVGSVVVGPGGSTTFSALAGGVCHVTAVNGSLTNRTGDISVFWLVENLDLGTVHPTIQKAINAANPGDRLRVKAWEYHEKVIVNKTVSLIGENKATTIIDGDWSGTTLRITADWVNITGFTITNGSGGGLSVEMCYDTTIDDCIVESNGGQGIIIGSAERTTITNTKVTSTGYGIYMYGWGTKYTTISNCNISANSQNGIYIQDDPRDTLISDCIIASNGVFGIELWNIWGKTEIVDCNISGSLRGMYLQNSQSTTIIGSDIWGNDYGIEAINSPITITDCNIYSNNARGLYLRGAGSEYRVNGGTITSNNNIGIYLESVSNCNIIGTIISNHKFGVIGEGSTNTLIINSSLSANSVYDINLTSSGHLTFVNSTFDESSVRYGDSICSITVGWYLNLNVENSIGSPISAAQVWVNNSNGANIFSGLTDSEGFRGWIICYEYRSNRTGHVSDYTPHNVTVVAAGYKSGYVAPEPFMGTSREYTIILTTSGLVHNLDTDEYFTTIQAAIDDTDTLDGHTLFILNHIYNEDIIVDKGVNLVGENRDNTIIFGSGGASNVMLISASGVTIDNLAIQNGDVVVNNTGSVIFTGTTVQCNDLTVSGQFDMMEETNILETSGNNLIMGSENLQNISFISGGRITVGAGGFFNVTNTTVLMDCSFNGEFWIQVDGLGEMNIQDLDENRWTMEDNSHITSNTQFGFMFLVKPNAIFNFQNSELSKCGWDVSARGLVIETDGVTIDGCTFTDNHYALSFISSTPSTIANSTIDDSNTYSAYLDSDSQVTFLNTTFEKDMVDFNDFASSLSVTWYLHVKVQQTPSLPASVRITNSTYELVLSKQTDNYGLLNWIILTEYIENQVGRNIYTPYIASAESGGLSGFENLIMEASRFITISTTSPQPEVDVELITGLQYSSNNVDYDIIASVSVSGQPRAHTPGTTLLVSIFDDDMNKMVDGDLMSILDTAMGLYTYTNITSEAGVYFVIVHANVSGISSVSMISFEVVDWIDDLARINDTLSGMNSSIGDLQDAIDDLNQSLPAQIDDLATQLTGVNDSIQSKLLSLNETNILSYLEGMNATLAADILNLLSSITNDIIDMNSSLSGQLIGLLNNMTTDHNALRNWLEIVLAEIDANLTATNSTLQTQLADLQKTTDAFYDSIQENLTEVFNSISQLETNLSSQHNVISSAITNLNDTIIGAQDLSKAEILDRINDSIAQIQSLDTIMTTHDSDIQSILTSLSNLVQNQHYLTKTELLDELDNLLGQLVNVDTNITVHDTDVKGDISTLSDLISNLESLTLSEIINILADLEQNLSQKDDTIASDLVAISQSVDDYQNVINGKLDAIDSTLNDLDNLEDILEDLQTLNQSLDAAQDSIDEIPTDKQEEEGFGMAEGLLILVIILLIIILLVLLMGRKGEGGSAFQSSSGREAKEALLNVPEEEEDGQAWEESEEETADGDESSEMAGGDFECPECGASVGFSETECPSCGEELEPGEEDK